MRRTRVLIADPHPVFRSGVSSVLTRESDLEAIEVANFDELVQAIESDCPDIALVDLELPPRGAVAAVAHLAGRCSAHVIVWSFDPGRATVLAAISAGASGYLHKEISAPGLVRSLRGAVRGEAPLPRHLASLMIEALHELEDHLRARARAAELSPREREVLDLVARGARNKEIAAELCISEFTVKRHVQNILNKLGLPSRKPAADLYRAAFPAGTPLVFAGERA